MPISSNKIQGSREKEIRTEQRRTGQVKARQGRAEREEGREGREEMKFLGVSFTRCTLHNAVCGPSMDLSEPWGQLDDGTCDKAWIDYLNPK